ncbi:hypothetical protein COLO4_23972 [Corchorus olitorius]|uniref:Uncharacterized protein n=1 Tax=Corchorus olitorius TaxID=93759 RepID=A0A1R3IDY0_9ROSI|nr:hypothetical protein COLO4_23972 [Corchorus olitorius]
MFMFSGMPIVTESPRCIWRSNMECTSFLVSIIISSSVFKELATSLSSLSTLLSSFSAFSDLMRDALKARRDCVACGTYIPFFLFLDDDDDDGLLDNIVVSI